MNQGINKIQNIYNKSISFEKRTKRVLALLAVLVATWLVLAYSSSVYTITVPKSGGSFDEIIVGYPRFVNPILATSQADKDVTALVHAGLYSKNAKGEVLPHLASGHVVSDDKKTYRVFLKENLSFHDGTELTIEDVLYTLNTIKDPFVKSPLYPLWLEVDVKASEENTTEVVFTLQESNENFLSNLTVAILPSHLWREVRPEEFPFHGLNISPVGAGPYKVSSVTRSNSELVTNYRLEAFADAPQVPFVTNISLHFYDDFEKARKAFDKNDWHFSSVSPYELSESKINNNVLHESPLKRVFSLFINLKTDSFLQEKYVREAIRAGINRNEIISKIFYNKAQATSGPLPSGHLYLQNTNTASTTSGILEAVGWAKAEDGIYVLNKERAEPDRLAFTLHVPDSSELLEVASLLKQQLAKEGIEITLRVLKEQEIIQSIIRPRDYELLLFGSVVDSDLAFNALWHSEGISDPGINISSFENENVDKDLLNLLKITNEENREKLYQRIQKEIHNEVPAVFLYTPSFIYTTGPYVKNININNISLSEERYNGIEEWYTQTQRILPFFNKK